jgi:hypothetical protein
VGNERTVVRRTRTGQKETTVVKGKRIVGKRRRAQWLGEQGLWEKRGQWLGEDNLWQEGEDSC